MSKLKTRLDNLTRHLPPTEVRRCDQCRDKSSFPPRYDHRIDEMGNGYYTDQVGNNLGPERPEPFVCLGCGWQPAYPSGIKIVIVHHSRSVANVQPGDMSWGS